MNQVSSQVVFVELVEVEIPQIVVADSVGKHVIDGYQDLMGYCYGGTLVTPPSFESVKFVSQISALSFRRGVGGLHQSRLHVHIALGNATTFALATRFIVARTDACPGGELRNILEHPHVHA
jgi:hypothetical protein